MRENKFSSTKDIVKMAEFVLKSNYFQFNSKGKQQISGTTIGAKFAPTYACWFMNQAVLIFLGHNKTFHSCGFVILLFFLHGLIEKTSLKALWKKLNQFHSNLNFTCQSSKKEIAFLDCIVNLFENKLTTDLYVRPTDTYQYLDYTSSHPQRPKKSIVYSQTLRMK